MKACEDYLKQLNISKDENIVVGCSYGPDSMCLLMLLYKMNFKIVCAHVNHKIRRESDEEYESLKKFCLENNILFEGLVLEEGNFNESHYRRKRYDFYRTVADKYNTKYIMTAHHGDDLVETILMRISRGSTLKGYRGFDKFYEEKGYIFIKPLVYVTKEEINNYNLENNIPFALDQSNDSDDYTRNRYRKYVLKELKKETKNVHLKYLQFSEEISDAINFIDSLVTKKFDLVVGNNHIDLNEFLILDEFLQKAILKKLLSIKYGDDIDKVNKEHVDNIVYLLSLGKNFEISLPLSIVCRREYDKLYLSEISLYSDYNMLLDEETILPSSDIIRMVESDYTTSNYVTRLNSNELRLPLFVRSKNDGDKIEIKNLNGSKKLKNIFIDEKIRKEERATWPVVVDSNNVVVWIPGLRKSKFDKTKDEKYDIILKYIKKGKDE